MKYAALLRGINVGGNNKVPMKVVVQLFESAGFTNVSTYINSGNIFFESDVNHKVEITSTILELFNKEFKFEIPTLIKTHKELTSVATAIPSDWTNDDTQKTDIAYLFPEADKPEIMDQLPFDHDFIDVLYTPGALIWNLNRENYAKSKLNKIIGSKLYRQMTVRNVNTARRLAQD
jgi:uncharacterized protein (DUF1697 family)